MIRRTPRSTRTDTLLPYPTPFRSLHAEIADYYFGLDTQYEVVAFTVDRQFVKAPTFRGRPVVAFEDLADRYPAAGHHAFVALGYSRINGLRKIGRASCRARGGQYV